MDFDQQFGDSSDRSDQIADLKTQNSGGELLPLPSHKGNPLSSLTAKSNVGRTESLTTAHKNCRELAL